VPFSISPDGTRLIVGENAPTGRELRVLRLAGGSGQTEPLAQTTMHADNGELSPDGRWLAYQSNESGQNQIYVRPFPNVDAGRWQISTSGGTRPAWARNGRELFYLDTVNAMTAVPVQATSTFNAGTPKKLFDGRDFAATAAVRDYDVSLDGQRFLMIKDPTSTPSMVVVVNWSEELKARVPAK
jgi:serine/threonine-protein kinase